MFSLSLSPKWLLRERRRERESGPLFLFSSGRSRYKETALDGKKFQNFPTFSFLRSFFFSFFLLFAERRSFGTQPAGFRRYQKHFIVSVRARHIRGLLLADALSRRHVCFSVVKRAAGRQTGLNQPPPLFPFLFFFLLLSSVPLLSHRRFLPPSPPASSSLLSPPRFSFALFGRTPRSMSQSGNKLLFVWTDKLVIRPHRQRCRDRKGKEKGEEDTPLFI